MAFEIKYSDEAKRNLDAITTWLLYERLAGETALRWLEGALRRIGRQRQTRPLLMQRPG